MLLKTHFWYDEETELEEEDICQDETHPEVEVWVQRWNTSGGLRLLTIEEEANNWLILNTNKFHTQAWCKNKIRSPVIRGGSSTNEKRLFPKKW